MPKLERNLLRFFPCTGVLYPVEYFVAIIGSWIHGAWWVWSHLLQIANNAKGRQVLPQVLRFIGYSPDVNNFVLVGVDLHRPAFVASAFEIENNRGNRAGRDGNSDMDEWAVVHGSFASVAGR